MNMERRRDPDRAPAPSISVPDTVGAAGPSPPRRKIPAGRGTFAGEARFLAVAVRLGAAVISEFLSYGLLACAFLILAPWYRKRMRRLILRSAGATSVAFALVFACGCGGRERTTTTETGDSWTFRGQMRQLEWSTKATIDQSDSRKSLEEDLDTLGPDRNWKESFLFDVRSLFLMDDAQKSLESDLKNLGEPENHGVKETIEMWGW
jgi:hypothetical protein